MPNRIIKESICRSDTINSLKPFEEVLFYRLIVVCDDYGRFDGRPEIIKGSCFPLKDTAAKDIGTALRKLAEVGLVDLYEVRGKPVLQLSTWSAHQQIRAKKSKYPVPDESCGDLISNDINCSQVMEDGCNSPRNRNTGIGNRESYPRNENALARLEVRHFEEFWSVYPLDKNRFWAEQAYTAVLTDTDYTEDDLTESAKNYAEYCRITGTDRVYHAGNFLSKAHFEDYLPGKYKRPEPKKAENRFNNFTQNSYDFDELEKKLLNN